MDIAKYEFNDASLQHLEHDFADSTSTAAPLKKWCPPNPIQLRHFESICSSLEIWRAHLKTLLYFVIRIKNIFLYSTSKRIKWYPFLLLVDMNKRISLDDLEKKLVFSQTLNLKNNNKYVSICIQWSCFEAILLFFLSASLVALNYLKACLCEIANEYFFARIIVVQTWKRV